jgi:hypothetical protein
MRERAKPKVRAYAEISVETNEIKQRLLQELNCSANQLAEMAIKALAADCARRRDERPAPAI